MRRLLDKRNVLGIAGLSLCAAFGTVLMIPRVLDPAIARTDVEAAKVSSLQLMGAVARPSWNAAHRVVQGFLSATS